MDKSELDEHSIVDSIEQFKSRIDEDEVKEKIEINRLNFFKIAIEFIENKLKYIIPALTLDSELLNIEKEIDAGLVQINTFLGNSNEGHLTNAENNLKTAVNRSRNLISPFSSEEFNFSKSISSFEQTVSDAYTSLENKNQELQKSFEEIQSELAENKEILESQNQEIIAKEKEIENLTASFQTQLDSIKSANEVEFESTQETFRTEFDNAKESFKSEFNEITTNADSETNNIVERLNKKLEEGKKIVNVIGNVGVTGNYQLIANDHKSTANVWRYVAITFMGIMSFFLVWIIWDISFDENYDWTKSLFRFVAAVAFSYPATYAARESSKHRKFESINRKLELELASIEPFIELLDEEEKKVIKKELVSKYFGNVDSEETPTEEISLNSLDRIVNTVLKILNK